MKHERELAAKSEPRQNRLEVHFADSRWIPSSGDAEYITTNYVDHVAVSHDGDRVLISHLVHREQQSLLTADRYLLRLAGPSVVSCPLLNGKVPWVWLHAYAECCHSVGARKRDSTSLDTLSPVLPGNVE